MSRHASLWILSALVLGSGCSFVLDFPEEGNETTSNGGGGNGTGGTGAGTEGGGGDVPVGGACGVAPEPTEIWHGTPTGESNQFDYVTVTGMALQGANVRAYGEASGDIEDLTWPSTPSNLLFAVEIDGGFAEDLASIVPCGGEVPNYSIANRISVTQDRLFISGALPVDDQVSVYGYSDENTDECKSSASYIPPGGSTEAMIPFFGLITEDFSADVMDPSDQSNGVTLDTTVNAGTTTGIGVASTGVFGAPIPDAEYQYFMTRSPENGVGNETAFLEIYANTDDFPLDLTGGIAVDDTAVVWGAGAACEIAGPCTGDSELFISYWPPASMPSNVEVNGQGHSFGSVLRFGGGRLFVGGGYSGELEVAGEALAAAVDTNAFVVAFDPDSRNAFWTYPAPGASPGFDTTGHEAVVDMALSTDADCGEAVVYVVGCVVRDDAYLQSCSVHRPLEQGRSMFIVKLDASSGEEIWSTVVEPSAPEQLLIPTSVTATSAGLWVATSLNGSVDLPGGAVETGEGTDALILMYPH